MCRSEPHLASEDEYLEIATLDNAFHDCTAKLASSSCDGNDVGCHGRWGVCLDRFESCLRELVSGIVE
jgi:hypothetical protein